MEDVVSNTAGKRVTPAKSSDSVTEILGKLEYRGLLEVLCHCYWNEFVDPVGTVVS